MRGRSVAAGRRGLRARGDRGQATVEVVVLLPLVVVLALLVVQAGILVQRRVLVTHAAREVARAAAVADGEVDAARATGLRGGLDAERLEVDTTVVEGRVEVVVRYRDPTDVAIVGGLVPDVVLEAGATMLLEGDPG